MNSRVKASSRRFNEISAPDSPIYFEDTFTRANSDILESESEVGSGTWINSQMVGANKMVVSSNTMRGNNNNDPGYAYIQHDFVADQYVECIMGERGIDSGSLVVLCRYRNNMNFYYALVSFLNGSCSIRKFVAGAATVLASGYSIPYDTTNSVVKLEVIGTTLKLYVNDVERLSITDSAFSAGMVGVSPSGITGNVLSFKGGEI